ncbi:hypothetical protein HC823_01580 [Candidatus Gracilibacteria bacterium]|nr:hypothetical protein [Candidatus Gracilibacteria bacterium]
MKNVELSIVGFLLLLGGYMNIQSCSSYSDSDSDKNPIEMGEGEKEADVLLTPVQQEMMMNRMNKLSEQYRNEKDLEEQWELLGRINYLKGRLDGNLFNFPENETSELMLIYWASHLEEQKKWEPGKFLRGDGRFFLYRPFPFLSLCVLLGKHGKNTTISNPKIIDEIYSSSCFYHGNTDFRRVESNGSAASG